MSMSPNIRVITDNDFYKMGFHYRHRQTLPETKFILEMIEKNRGKMLVLECGSIGEVSRLLRRLNYWKLRCGFRMYPREHFLFIKVFEIERVELD